MTKLLLLLFTALLSAAPVAAAPPLILGLDHIPLAVRDLDQAGRDFARLGFTIKPGRPHDNGIRNLHVKFADRTEIELITAAEPRDALSGEYVDHLRAGDGPAFVAFYAPDFDALAARLTALHQPYRHDWATVALPSPPALRHIFFSARLASPTDSAAYFTHANSADGLIGVWLAGAESPPPELALLEALGARVAPGRAVNVPGATTALVAQLAEGEVIFLPAQHQQVPGRRIIGAILSTRDLSALKAAMAANGLTAPEPVLTPNGRSIFVPSESAHGLWLEFREQAQTTRSRNNW
ncbi:MAG TPA: VOC family protein [Pseudoduganella sp.]